MLIGAVDRGVHGHLPLNQASRISLRKQPGHNCVPCSIATETSVTFPDGLPRTERIGQIPPRDTRPIPINDAFENAAVVLKRTTRTIPRRWHQRRESSPFTVRQHGNTRHASTLSDRTLGIRRQALALPCGLDRLDHRLLGPSVRPGAGYSETWTSFQKAT